MSYRPQIRIVPRSPRDPDLPPRPYPTWGAPFCAFVAQVGNLKRACLQVGITWQMLQRYRFGDEPWAVAQRGDAALGPCPEFALDVESAMQEAVEMLRDEAWRLAMKGNVPMLQMLLKAHDPDLYNPPTRQQHEITDGSDAASMDALRRKILDRLAAMDAPPLALPQLGPTGQVIEGESHELLDEASGDG